MSLEALPSQFPFPGWEALTSSDLPAAQSSPPQLRLLTDVPLPAAIYNRDQVMSWPGMANRPDLVEVLECLVRGMSARETAEYLSVAPRPKRSVNNINRAVHDLFQKSGTSNRHELVSLAKDPLEVAAEVPEKRNLRALG